MPVPQAGQRKKSAWIAGRTEESVCLCRRQDRGKRLTGSGEDRKKVCLNCREDGGERSDPGAGRMRECAEMRNVWMQII